MRYKNTKISNIGGKLSYDTTYYPSIPIQDSDQLKYFPRGTRFDKIAFDYYGDTSLWWIITKANEVSNADDISVILAEADENIITLGFDIEIDENSIPNTGMFRVSINGNKSKINGIQLSAQRREAYLELKYPITNGDNIKLSYIDAKGNQKDNIIDAIKVSCRKITKQITGKKPITSIKLVRI